MEHFYGIGAGGEGGDDYSLSKKCLRGGIGR